MIGWRRRPVHLHQLMEEYYDRMFMRKGQYNTYMLRENLEYYRSVEELVIALEGLFPEIRIGFPRVAPSPLSNKKQEKRNCSWISQDT